MQDPSQGVASQLQNHVHLISSHRFPLNQTITLDQAYRSLVEAPTIVKQIAPMAWQYVQSPRNGTLWLEWISAKEGEYPFPSDGYVWGDQETARREDFGGYTIEILTHTIGFRPGYDQMATHARSRYHFVAKHPNANAPPPDPNLWLVHYHQADQRHYMPHNQLPVHPLMRQQMGVRRWLESQGRIERREFMLHDREHWPQVTLPYHMPHRQQNGPPGMNSMMAQQPEMAQQKHPPGMSSLMAQPQEMPQQKHPPYPWEAASQGPPSKRPRHSGPSDAPGSSDGPLDVTIEDEENVSLGDYFDHLSQRDISTARYMQHHRWMEEIFSSPYASSQIVPPDLGLGLMGALKGLTEGIVEAPSVKEINSSAPKPPKAKEATRFTNLKKEQVEEFNVRVQKHLDEGNAEIERMKKEHAERMAEFKKGSVFMQAEKRLRNASWKEREEIDPAFKLDGIAHGSGSGETVEDIIKEVEGRLNVRITGYEDSTVVEKGGFQEKDDNMKDDFFTTDAPMDGMQQEDMSGVDGGVSAVPDGFQHGPSTTTETQAEALQNEIPEDVPQSNIQADPQAFGQGLAGDGQMNQPPAPEQEDGPGHHDDDDDMFGDGGMELGDASMIEGVDMDVDVDNGGIDTGNIDFMDDPTASGGLVDAAGQVQSGMDMAAAALPSSTEGEMPEQVQAAQAEEQQVPATTAPTSTDPTPAPPPAELQPASDLTVAPASGDATNAIDFKDTTFDDLDNIDNSGLGDDDVDFGMDESAFEGAMHGMDDPEEGQ